MVFWLLFVRPREEFTTCPDKEYTCSDSFSKNRLNLACQGIVQYNFFEGGYFSKNS